MSKRKLRLRGVAPSFDASATGAHAMSLSRALSVIPVMAIACTAMAAPPPSPPPVPFVESVNGVEIQDPYRWMERDDATFRAWARAESEYARHVLDSIPGRTALRARIAALDVAPSGISSLQVRGGRWLYTRSAGDGSSPRLYTRDGSSGAERPVELLGSLPAGEGPWSEVTNARVLSPDGRYVTFGTTRRGESDPALRVFDLEKNRLLPDVIEWPLWADADGFRPKWLADGSGFLYVRRPDATAALDDAARARRGQIFLHRLGVEGPDRALFGYGITRGIDETDTLYVAGEPHARWLSILNRRPSGREIWVLDLAELGRDEPPPARRIFSSDVLVRGHGVRGDTLYTLAPEGAPRYRLVKFDLRAERPAQETVLPEQQGVLSAMVVAQDAVYVLEALLSRATIHAISEDGGVRAVSLPDGSVRNLSAGSEGRGATFSVVDWLTPARSFELDPGTAAARPLSESDEVPAALAGFVSRLEWATARDGTRIPYTIVEATPGKRDGSAYVILDGYGCFGTIGEPFYWPSLVAWLERGGAFVRVALRGGGELGAEWREAGRDRNKPTSFEDAIDVTKHLIRTGVTRAGRVGVSGGSCGGATMGMAALEAPHLIGAAALSVGAFDMWRLAGNSSAGARSIRDFGDPATADGTRRILALSPYYQVLDGAQRPAMLIGSGATDYAIPLWVGGKMVARSRAASENGKPVLWNIEWTAGHNAGVDYVQLDTDLMGFMFWQLGHPDFAMTLSDPH